MKFVFKRNVFVITGLLSLCLLVILLLIIFREDEHQRVTKCAYDGGEIDLPYEVQFIMKNSEVMKFCSIVCALQLFPQLKEKIASVLVTDEVSGQKVSAKKAFFIESSVVTVPHVNNRIHAFASEVEAVRHRDQYSGKHINNPFILFSSWREEILKGRRIRIKIDPITGLTRIIKGDPYITVLRGFDLDNLKEKGAIRSMQSLISLLGNYLEVEIEELKFAGMERIGGSWFISFWQTYGGVIVFESSIGFSIDPGGGVPSIGALLHKGLKAFDLPTKASISLKEAKEVAIAHLREREPLAYKLAAYQLILYPMEKGGRVIDYYLAYILNFYYPEEFRVTRSQAGWVCFVDAVTGKILNVQSLVAIASCCTPVKNEN